MWLLALNVGHNGSVGLYKDSELIFYVEEERLTGYKYDGNPFLGIEHVYKYTDHIDVLLLCYTRNSFSKEEECGDIFSIFVKKKQPYHEFKVFELGEDHHLIHAATAFYNSKFDSAAALIVDGAGSDAFSEVKDFGIKIIDSAYGPSFIDNDDDLKYYMQCNTWEVESIWTFDYPAVVKRHLVHYGGNKITNWTHNDDNINIEISTGHGIVKSYEAVTDYLGFDAIEAGKTMGLSSYGKFSPSIKIDNGKYSNLKFIKPSFPARNIIITDFNPIAQRYEKDKDWHTNPELVGEYRKDIAYAVQKSSERRVIDLIEKTIELTKKKKIVMAGGYGLNCVANYEFVKRFPNIEFYHEPVSHDGGQVMGACQLYYRKLTGDSVKTPLKDLYIGPTISIDYENVDYTGFNLSDSTAKEVAELIAAANIVTIYQGRSEAGPRALGNRSILFDPTVKDGKDLVNRVKKREWFRPFAGSCLAESVHDWFDMAGLKESPFMMYAVDVLADKKDIIPSITHVDGTCRIQTVTSEQNPHYYELISEFNKIRNVPILFNTSFNLGGDPLVETMNDALSTLRRSDIKYLWLPEIKKLVTKI
jgi:carbamoyltransferase